MLSSCVFEENKSESKYETGIDLVLHLPKVEF